MLFVVVPEPKAGKVRIHLEVTVDDVEGAIDLVAGLAGRTTGERHDNDRGAVVVMTDPDGREFSFFSTTQRRPLLSPAVTDVGAGRFRGNVLSCRVQPAIRRR